LLLHGSTHLVMLNLDPLEPRTPELPRLRFGPLRQLATSAALHVTLVTIAASVTATSPQIIEPRQSMTVTDQRRPDVRHVVFLAPAQKGGGGGGGGNQQAAPVRRAQGLGSDKITLRVRKPPVPTASVTPASSAPIDNLHALPSVVLDAKPLASGIFDQIGLPTVGRLSGASTGPGSGGGVGTGIGAGIGSGRGPGLGPGSGGGTGGGIYRPGGAISGPHLIKEVKPTYTNDALRHKIQGTVVLEVVVTVDGCPSQIRVIRSLDPRGLDAQAVAAVAQWQFEPGRLGDTPVDVLVTIQLDFRIW
jgi:TonB family protein